MSESRPAEPPAPYIGGKKQLAGRLVRILDQIPHTTYAEPFLGMGGIFLRRRRRSHAEVVNDISRDVATLFRILQRHYPQFMETLKFQVTSRTEFERLVKVAPETLTDLERAARFLYLQRTSFGGKVVGRSFGIAADRPARFDVIRLGPMLEAIHERIAGVTIECLPWADFIERYDSAETLFYLDPPYWGCETDYGAGVFTPGDFTRLADRLSRIAGRFILSINDASRIRESFAAFTILEVPTVYSISKEDAKPVTELLISNLPEEALAHDSDQGSLL